MGDHETILKMIEEVDPSDTAKLDEIDARVYLFLNWINDKFVMLNFLGIVVDAGGLSGHETILIERLIEYTRSRDALKSVRPKGHSINMDGCNDDLIDGSYSCYLYNNLADFSIDEFKSPSLPTEELAELHAIIQAIAYERSKNDQRTRNNTTGHSG